MASLALPSARPWRAMGMRSPPTNDRRRPPRGGRPPPHRAPHRRVAQLAHPAGRSRLLVANGRCWGRRGSAPRAGDDGPPRSSVRPTRHSPPHGDIRVVPGWLPLTALGFARAPNRSWRLAALNDQQKMPGVDLYGANSSRARARGALPPAQLLFSGFLFSDIPLAGEAAARARRWCATAPRSNNCVEGAYGIARFAEREAVESDGLARSTCRVRELRDAPVRRSVRQPGGRRAAADVDRLLVAIGRCWRRRGSAPRAGAGVRWRRRATAQQRATNTTLAATQRHR